MTKDKHNKQSARKRRLRKTPTWLKAVTASTALVTALAVGGSQAETVTVTASTALVTALAVGVCQAETIMSPRMPASCQAAKA